MVLIRYPGSKHKLVTAIKNHFPCKARGDLLCGKPFMYAEPFFGAGAIGLSVLNNLPVACKVVFNDIDPGIAALWLSVKDNPVDLCRAVQAFRPTVEAFYEFKSLDGTSTGNLVTDGFRKLALHRMSVSGFGVMAGGPIGGRHQGNKEYTVECRWTESSIKRQIMILHNRMRRFRDLTISCVDFDGVIAQCGPSDIAYCDPPYYEKGGQLYKHSMSGSDHERLATTLGSSICEWVLSYDDHPAIRSLFSWAEFHELEVRYSNAVCNTTRPKNREVLILPKRRESTQ